MQATWPVLDFVLKLAQRLYPSGKYAFRTFERIQPLQAMVVRPEDNFRLQEVVPEVLKG